MIEHVGHPPSASKQIGPQVTADVDALEADAARAACIVAGLGMQSATGRAALWRLDVRSGWEVPKGGNESRQSQADENSHRHDPPAFAGG